MYETVITVPPAADGAAGGALDKVPCIAVYEHAEVQAHHALLNEHLVGPFALDARHSPSLRPRLSSDIAGRERAFKMFWRGWLTRAALPMVAVVMHVFW